MENTNSISKFIKMFAGAMALGLVAFGFVFFKDKAAENQGGAESSLPPPPPPPPSLTPSPSATPPSSITPPLSATPQPSISPSPALVPSPAAGKYKDGKYAASGTYRSPAQQEEINIEILLSGDKVLAAEFFENFSNPTTEKMQKQFKEGFKEFVVGKNLDEISLTVVNGSSLTPKGFMDALAKIKAQAGGS